MKIHLTVILLIISLSQSLLSQVDVDTLTISEIEETGDYQKALLKTKIMLETDSLNENLWTEIARLYRLNQQYKPAISAYEMAFKINPANKKHMLSLAKTNNLAGNRDYSIKLYRDFLEFEPNNIMALSELAISYSSINQTDSAAKTYKKLYLLDTTNVEYLQKWASNQWFAGQIQEAFSNYKTAFRLDSFYLPVVYDLSRIYINNKMQDSAIAILRMNIKHSPAESRLYADLGNAIFSTGDYDNAIPEYEKAILLGYKTNEVYKRLGICYYATKYFEKSKQMFEMLILKDTTDYKVCMYLGHIYNNFGEATKAIVFFNRAIDLLLPDPMVITAIYTGLIESYHANKNYMEQIAAIEKRNKYIPLQYQSPQDLLEIAEVYELSLKNKKMALKYYQDYYQAIQEMDFQQDKKDTILSKINRLKQDLKSEK